MFTTIAPRSEKLVNTIFWKLVIGNAVPLPTSCFRIAVIRNAMNPCCGVDRESSLESSLDVGVANFGDRPPSSTYTVVRSLRRSTVG